MKSKIHKYFYYLLRFAKSPNKRVVIKELSSEIKEKGMVHGVRSLLHRKIHLKGIYYKNGVTHELVIRKFNRKTKVVLPAVTSPKVSIIIPMYNQLDYTFNCVYSVFKSSEFKDYEIIIADDNSKENAELLKESFENIVLIRNPENLGFLKNCNNAAQQARGEYLVFLNNDTQVQQNWLEELLNIFTNFDKVGIAGSKLVYPDGALQEAGGIIWQDGSGWNYGNRDNPFRSEYNYVKEADYISGASIMIPKRLWDELGGFDELYLPAYCEDSDLCFKVRDKGFKVMYQPFSVVVHFEGVTHGKRVSKGIKQYQVVNQRKFYERWQHELQKKSRNGENVFFERDRTLGKKHVLVIDHYLPTIDKDAGSRTIANFIDSLLELGYTVMFLGENQNSSMHYQALYQGKGVHVLYGHEFNFYDKSWRKYLKQHLNDIDAFVLSRSHVCKPILSFLKDCNYKGNTIYYGHDLGFLRMEQEGKAKNDQDMIRQARNLKEQEDFMYANASSSLVISSEETAYLKKYITQPLHYVPPYFFDVRDDLPSYSSREGILFVGGFNHPPNRDAILWFLDEIYEPLHQQHIALTIAGSKMPKSVFKYKERFSLLNVLSDVSNDELEGLYAKTRIAVVPLKSGAGVKGKVIEAMAKGVPVVGTDIAFEGMPKNEQYLYKGANTPQELIDNILAVYSDENKWKTLSGFGKQYVRDNFNKQTMKDVFKKIVG